MTTRVLTTQQMADYLQIATETLKRATRTGRVPVIRIGPRAYRYDRDAVMAAFQGSTPVPRNRQREKVAAGEEVAVAKDYYPEY